MQQLESSKFLLQVSNASASIFTKLDYQKNFMLLPHQIKVKENELKVNNEITVNKKKFTVGQVNENDGKNFNSKEQTAGKELLNKFSGQINEPQDPQSKVCQKNSQNW